MNAASAPFILTTDTPVPPQSKRWSTEHIIHKLRKAETR